MDKFDWAGFFSKKPENINSEEAEAAALAAVNWKICAVGTLCHELGREFFAASIQKSWPESVRSLHGEGINFADYVRAMNESRTRQPETVEHFFGLAKKKYAEIEQKIAASDVEIKTFLANEKV